MKGVMIIVCSSFGFECRHLVSVYYNNTMFCLRIESYYRWLVSSGVTKVKEPNPSHLVMSFVISVIAIHMYSTV